MLISPHYAEKITSNMYKDDINAFKSIYVLLKKLELFFSNTRHIYW